MKKLLLLLVGAVMLAGCGSLNNKISDAGRDLSPRNYQLTLYAADGHAIWSRTLEQTFVDVGENGSGLRWVENGKLHMVNGTYELVQR